MKLPFFYICLAGSAIMMCGLLSSCDNLLDVRSPIDQINSAQVFESTSTADAALSNLYAELQYYSLLNGGSGSAGALLGTYTDELISYDEYNNDADRDLYNNVQQASNTSIKTFWSNAYKEIYLANSILEGVESSTAIPENDKKRIRGEALFVRSLVLYYLTQVFGDIPYPTSTDFVINQSLPKMSESQMLAVLTDDLTETVSLLNDQYTNPERIYPNRKTAQLVLATVLMTQKKDAEAEPLLKEIVQNSMYVWEGDLSKTFKKNGKHIMWQLKPLNAGDATNEAVLYYFEDALPYTYTLSNTLYNSFASNDLRRTQWIKALTIDQATYYRSDKYVNTIGNSDEYSIVFRLEEAYLLLAEALVNQNKLGEALPYLNAVKEKAGIDLSPAGSSKEQLVKALIDENRKEFFTERGIRFLSLKRAGRLNDLLPSKPNWKDYHLVWPIPRTELLLNANLNPQNNGY